MTFPTAEEIWSTLVCMAEAICEEIEKLRPEVILVMYKSGSAIWRAAETRWRMTRRLPLPPVVGANIGPSKYGVYEREGYEWDGLEFADWIDTGHLVAWAVRHEEWVKALHQRIAEQSGLEAPGSFLIIDDVVAEGRTTVIVKSLLWAIYPNADSVLVAGMDGYWRETLGEAWFRELNPSPMPSIHDIWAQTEFLTANHINTAYNTLWRNLLSGLANHRTDPFGWCPLAPTHPVPTHLSAYMPVDVWLQFPEWVATMTICMLERQLKTGINPMTNPPILRGNPWELRYGVVRKEIFLCALAWLQPWVSLEEAAKRCNVTQERIQAMLAECAQWSCFVPVEVESVAGFSLAPDIEPR